MTLIIVLLILLVVTVLGIGAAQIALLGERSARFDRDFQVAWQAAEAALMDAEFDIRGPNSAASARVSTFTNANRLSFEVGCGTGMSQGLCQASETGKPVWYQVDFLTTGAGAKTVEFGTFTGRTFDSGSLGVKPARAPRYIVEVINDASGGVNRRIDALPKNTLYRITAMGFGPREEIQAVLQTVFRKE